jgi:hypothetical protein
VTLQWRFRQIHPKRTVGALPIIGVDEHEF